MRISRVFNQNIQISLAVKTLATDSGSVSVLGAGVAEHLAKARDYFSNTTDPTVDPNNKLHRRFALPIIDALIKTTDPTFSETTKGVNPSSEHADWILKIYADRAAQKGRSIKSEDLQKIYTEIGHFEKVKHSIGGNGNPSKLYEYQSYDEFTDVVRPLLSKNETYRTLQNAPDHILENTTILYNGEEGSIIVPHTYEASVYFGSVHWCVSYDNTEGSFEDYNAKSPIVMYSPSNKSIKTSGKDITTGKIAVVEEDVYDENDEKLDVSPQYVMPLHDAALSAMSSGKKEYLKNFGIQEWEEEEVYNNHLLSQDQKNGIRDIIDALDGEYDDDYCESIEDIKDERPELFSDRDVMIEVVRHCGSAIEYINDDIKDDVEIIAEALANDTEAPSFIDENLLQNEEVIRRSIECGAGWMLCYAEYPLNDDYDLVFKAVKKDQWALANASERLRNNETIATECLLSYSSTLKNTGNDLRKNPSFVRKATEIYSEDIKYVSPKIDSYRDLCLAAVEDDGRNLEHIDVSLKNDREIVLAAINHNGSAIYYASKDLQKDPELLKISLNNIKYNGDDGGLKHIKNNVWDDKKLALLIASKQPPYEESYLQYFSKEIQKDPDIAIAFTEANLKSLEHVDSALLKDPTFMKKCLSLNSQAFEYADQSLKEDPDFVLDAIAINGHSFCYADKKLRNDRDFVMKAVKICGNALSGANKELRANEKIIFAAIEQDGKAFSYAEGEYTENRDIALKAVKNGYLIDHKIKHAFRCQRVFIMAHLKNGNKLCMDELIGSLQYEKDINLISAQNGTTPYDLNQKLLYSEIDIALSAIHHHGITDGGVRFKDLKKSLLENDQFVLSVLNSIQDKEKPHHEAFIAQMHKIPSLFGYLTCDIQELSEILNKHEDLLLDKSFIAHEDIHGAMLRNDVWGESYCVPH